MSTKPVVIVSGLGRCGTTMVMNMLAAGGMTCAGFAPAYEDERTGGGPLDREWFESLSGQAVKILNPHQNPPPKDVPSVAIWLDRNPKDQARSQAKFVHLLAGMPLPDRGHMLRWRKSLTAERADARETLRKNSQIVLSLAFETVLQDPGNAAWTLADALKRWAVLDTKAMAAVVIRRSPVCAPDLAIETALMRQTA